MKSFGPDDAEIADRGQTGPEPASGCASLLYQWSAARVFFVFLPVVLSIWGRSDTSYFAVSLVLLSERIHKQSDTNFPRFPSLF